MLSVEEALARILDGLVPTTAETVGVAEAWGRVTAAPISARLDQPPRDVSAMDGYAVRAQNFVAGTSLQVVGSAPAGHPWTGDLEDGQAVRLFTGSVLPAGADAVLMQEDAELRGAEIRPIEPPVQGRHIRRARQDFARGDVLVAAGRRLTARDVGLAAAGNHPWVAVFRRPRVAVLATGDEIVLPGEDVPQGSIVSSNALVLAAMIRAAGGEPTVLPIAADDVAALAAGVDAACGFDLLLSTGGASVGDHDLVREALAARGMDLDFWKVAMRPGKPLGHGRIAGLPVLALPGNPVSCYVTALLFAIPAIRRLGGEQAAEPLVQSAALGRDLPANDARADHLRARLEPAEGGRLVVTPFEQQDSARLRQLSQAGALVLRPPHAPAAHVGDIVPILPLEARLL